MISDEDFARIAGEALDSLPDKFTTYLRNVAIVYADEPTQEQRERNHLQPQQTLLGLYEGIPQTNRGANYSMVLPDKITIFKIPLLRMSQDQDSLRKNIRHTLWHEIAHHFGLGHDRIHELEGKSGE